MKLEWREAMETGHADIDGHHKELFQKIQDIITACKNGNERHEVINLLNFLKQYVQTHFSTEEQLQSQSGYVYRREHAEQHQLLLSRLAALEAEHDLNGASLPVVTNALKLTYEWLTWHILEWDKMMSSPDRPKENPFNRAA